MYLKSFLAIALVALAGSAHAQGFSRMYRYHNDYATAEKHGQGKLLQRNWVAYSLPFSSLSISEHFQQIAPDINNNGVYQANPKPSVDTSLKRHLKRSAGWGVAAGTFYPVGMLGEKSCIDISVSGSFILQSWNVDSVRYSPLQSDLVDNSGQALVIMASLPVGVDYRYGGDAALDKQQRFMFTAGVGASPTLVAAGYGSAGDVSYKTIPYVKAELGFFAGIAFKVQFMANLGKITYYNYEDDDRFAGSGGTKDITKSVMTGAAPFTISLMLMPYSWHWGDLESVGNEKW